MLLIHLLLGGEPGFVNAIIDMVVYVIIYFVDDAAQIFWVEIQVIACQLIEGSVEDTQQISGFVIDNRAALFIPQYRHRDPPSVGRVGHGIELVVKLSVIDRIAAGAFVLMVCPTVAQHQRANVRSTYQRFQTFQFAHDQRTVRPGAGERYIKVVAIRLGRITVALRLFTTAHPIAQLRGLTYKLTAMLFGVIPLVYPLTVYKQSHQASPTLNVLYCD